MKPLPSLPLALFLALSRSLIQLQAGDFPPCTSWTNNTIASIKALIRRAVIGAITDSCDCVYTQDLFDNEQLLCDQSRPLLAVYRAEIASTNMISSHDVVAIIEQWASESATYTEEVFIVTFDSTCPVRITSTNDPVCEMSSSNGGSNATAIVATVVVIILVFIATVYPEIFTVTFISRDEKIAKIRLSKILLQQIFCTVYYYLFDISTEHVFD